MGERGRGEREGETLDMPSGELLLLWICERRKGRKGGGRRGDERRGVFHLVFNVHKTKTDKNSPPAKILAIHYIQYVMFVQGDI